MPVTAKFSKAFYDRLGHETVDELVNHLNQVDQTYRGEVRELNELNFARFDAKLEQRVVQLEAKVDQVAGRLDGKIDRVAGELNAKIDLVAAELYAKIDRVAVELDAKIDRVATDLRAELKARLPAMEARLVRWMFVFVASGTLAILGLR